MDLIDEIQFQARQPVIRHQPPADSDKVPPDFRETRIENAARLRIKESDRLRTTAALIEALGGTVRELPDGLVITGQPALAGGSVDASGDHRIAMSAAVAACGCTQPVTVCGSACVAKSYPAFWEDFTALQEEAL